MNSILAEVITKLGAGVIFRITYKTEMPVSAKNKREGIRVYKIVSQCTRTGVSYDNIQEVIDMRKDNEDKTSHSSYCFPVVLNRIYQHKNTGTQYLRLARVNKHSNTKVQYVMIDKTGSKPIDETEARGYTIPSAWKYSGPSPVVKNIKLENILAINNVSFT